MSVLSFIPVIGKVLDSGLGIIDKLVEDKDKANEIKAAIKHEILVNQHELMVKELDAQAKIVLAEVQGAWIQRNWRPLLALTCVVIIFNNFVFFPYASALFGGEYAVMLELPDKLWNVLLISVGGYIAGRSGEKIADTVKRK